MNIINDQESDFVCIYHANCSDGFAAAWVVRKAFGMANRKITFIPATYGDPLPDVVGKVVYIVDFCYKTNDLSKIVEMAKEVILLDHHKTSIEPIRAVKESCIDSSNFTYVIDMDRSGARIAWDYFFAPASPPPVLLRIEDRDLWRNKFTDTECISLAIRNYPMEFSAWSGFMHFDNDSDLEFLREEGRILLRAKQNHIDAILHGGLQVIKFGNHRVYAVNAPSYLSSDIGNILAKNMPFSVSYYEKANTKRIGDDCGNTEDTIYICSLRSNDNGIDVSEIAKKYGGGGHRNAAGFSTLEKPWITQGTKVYKAIK